MTGHRNKIVVAVAALAAVATGGGAVAATQLSSPKQESQAIVNDAAEELGVEPSELSAALKEALKNRVDAAVAAGRLTEAQGNAMKERIDSGEVPLVGLGPGGPGHHGMHGVHGGLDAAAAYLGMTQANLRTALENGKTLAQVARSRGKSVDGLVTALVADAKKKLADGVQAGRLTDAQRDAMQADLKARLTDMVNGVRPTHPGRGGPGGPGFGPPPGDAPQDAPEDDSSSSTALTA